MLVQWEVTEIKLMVVAIIEVDQEEHHDILITRREGIKVGNSRELTIIPIAMERIEESPLAGKMTKSDSDLGTYYLLNKIYFIVHFIFMFWIVQLTSKLTCFKLLYLPQYIEYSIIFLLFQMPLHWNYIKKHNFMREWSIVFLIWLNAFLGYQI